MIDWRLYRLAFVALIPAVVTILFSVEPVAEPLPPGIATTGFDGRAAASTAREIERLGQDRAPGSATDDAAAELVAGRFSAIPAGEVSTTLASAGSGTSPIVSVSLPGASESAILVVAPRTGGSAAGRLATATATGVLAQLAGSFGDARHEHSLVFASAPDATTAAELARRVSQERDVIGSVSIDDARGLRTDDVLLHHAPGDLMASATLAETARAVIGGEGIPDAPTEGPLAQIARLGLGISFGGQARMLGEGIDAIAISATGERPPHDGDGAPVRVVSEPLGFVGEIALRVVQALDAAPELPDKAGAYVRFGDNVVPRWAFALLGLALLAPALIAAVDALARAARRGRRATMALQSVFARALPFVASALLLYALAIVGVVPDPSFPFDPADFGLGFGEILTLAIFGLVGAGVGWALRVDVVPTAYGAQTLAAAAGLVASLAALGIWIANPFAALLVAPLAHVWVVATGSRSPGLPAGGLALVASVAPFGFALGHIAGRLDLGSDGPWTLTMLVTGGQLRPAQALIACILAGALVSVAASSKRGASR